MKRFALILLAAMSGPALAAEWFVSPNGNDSTGHGTLASPFRTVKHVLDTSLDMTNPGDTITLRAGTYNECDVRLRKPLTLQSYAGERGHIHCDITVSDSVTIEIDTGASGSHLNNLEISGGMYYGVMLQTDWYHDSGTGPSNVMLENLYVHDTGRDGFKITPKSNHVTIRHSEIAHTGAAEPPGTPLDDRNADGIDSVNVSFLLIQDNYIHDISTTGMYFKGGASDVIAERNRVENTGLCGICVGFDTSVEFFDTTINPHFYENVRGIVRNNVVRNTVYEGIGMYSAQNPVVVNNTIINTANEGHAAIYFGTPAQDWDDSAGRPPTINPLIRNNLVIQNGGSCVEIRYFDELNGYTEPNGLIGVTGSPNTDYNAYYNTTGPCVFADGRPGHETAASTTLGTWASLEGSDTHSINAILSVDATGHLPAGSPAINAGTTVTQVTDDIDGQQRFAPFDIGADEVSAPPPNEIFKGAFD